MLHANTLGHIFIQYCIIRHPKSRSIRQGSLVDTGSRFSIWCPKLNVIEDACIFKLGKTHDGLLYLCQTLHSRRKDRENSHCLVECAKESSHALSIDVRNDIASAKQRSQTITHFLMWGVSGPWISSQQGYWGSLWNWNTRSAVSTADNDFHKQHTSYSTPEMHSLPRALAAFAVRLRTPRGSTDSGSWVPGSKNETKKKGTLSSHGRRR